MRSEHEGSCSSRRPKLTLCVPAASRRDSHEEEHFTATVLKKRLLAYPGTPGTSGYGAGYAQARNNPASGLFFNRGRDLAHGRTAIFSSRLLVLTTEVHS